METKWTLFVGRAKLTPFDISLDYNILNILNNRGITKKKDIIKFIQPSLNDLEDPSKLVDMNIAIKRIVLAIKNKEKICIYGDYDVDGISSTSLLYLSLKKLDANVSYYIPLRNEGYGLNKQALQELKESGIDLVISVDCGISSFEEANYAKSINLDLIITDHHDISASGEIPKAIACINPKRIDNEYSFPNIAGVGVSFLLVYELFRYYNILEEVYEYLDLVALGTIADIMPLIKENRIFVKFGLEKLKNTRNLGLKTILKKIELENKELTSGDISFKVAPIFNAVGRLSDAKLAVKLLISDNLSEINALADTLISNNISRKKIQEEIIEKVFEEIENKKLNENYILISHSPNYHHGIIGIVASKILENYYKPTIIMEENPDEGIAVASCRSIEGFNITKALSYVSKLLIKFGGHSNAAGFTIKLENIEEFKKQIEIYAKKELEGIKLVKNINIDMKIPAQKISYEFIQSLHLLKPFGFGNPTPILMTENCIIHNFNSVGNDNKHLKFDLEQKGFSVKNAIWFNNGNLLSKIKSNSNIFYDIVFKLEINEYQNRFYPSVMIEDMKKSELKDDILSYYHSIFYTSFPMKSVFYTTLDIDIDSKIYLKKNFKNYSILSGQKTISKLENNISNLLSTLNELYNIDFELKIEEIIDVKTHKIVHILIKRKLLLENYTNKDNVMFRNIKKFLLGDLEYNSFNKEALSVFYKENKSLFINKDNINIYLENKKIDIKEDYFYDLLLTIAIKYYFDYNKKINFYTKNKKFKNDNFLKTYCNFLDKILVTSVEDICIYDFNSIEIPNFKLKYKKCVIFSNKVYTKKELYVIKKDIKLENNILKFKTSVLNSIDYDNIFLHFIPNNDKIKLINKIKEGKIIYADESIIKYY